MGIELIPDEGLIALGEGRDKTTTSSVNMDRDIISRFILVVVENVGNLLDRVVVTRVGTSQREEHTDGIAIKLVLQFFSVKGGISVDGNHSGLHIKEIGESNNAEVRIATDDDVRANKGSLGML